MDKVRVFVNGIEYYLYEGCDYTDSDILITFEGEERIFKKI